MKKIFLMIIALGAAAAIFPAAAQVETNVPPDQGAAPAENGGLPPGTPN